MNESDALVQKYFEKELKHFKAAETKALRQKYFEEEIMVEAEQTYLKKLLMKAVESSKRKARTETTFTTECNFFISLFLPVDKSEAIIDHLEEIHGRNIKRYGEQRARVLYAKETLVSLWPILRWALRRAVVAGVLKHYFPAIESLMRLFH